MVYVLQKFRHYLLGSHFNMYTDHYALRYLVNKPVLGGEYEDDYFCFRNMIFELVVKLGMLNARPNHLSRILSGEYTRNIDDNLKDMHLFVVKMVDDYFTDIV
jgi:hypothetical protein